MFENFIFLLKFESMIDNFFAILIKDNEMRIKELYL